MISVCVCACVSVCVLKFIPLPPEGSVATSLLTGKPAPSPLFNTGPSDGFSCHVKPSKLIAAQKERQREKVEGGRECERTYGLNGHKTKEILKANPLNLICHLINSNWCSFYGALLLHLVLSIKHKVAGNLQHKNGGK